MNDKIIKTATGGETIYKNSKRRRFILGLPAAIAFFTVILFIFRTEFEPWMLVLIPLVFMVDVIVLIVFIGKSPNIVLSPRYFGFTRYFGVYRVRWDRVRQVDIEGTGAVKQVIITFQNDKGVTEKMTLKPASYAIGDGLIDEIKRLRAGGF